MREEVLDQLDVVSGDADEVAAPAAREIRRRERVELPEHVEAHVGEQPIGGVVREPGLEPVQQAGERRDDAEREEERARGIAVLHRADGERAQHADADQRDDPRDAEDERRRRACRDSRRSGRSGRGGVATTPSPPPG